MMATDDTKMRLRGISRGYARELVACTHPYMIQTITQVLSNLFGKPSILIISTQSWMRILLVVFKAFFFFLMSKHFVASGSIPQPGEGSDWGHSQSAWGLHGQPS